jgi:ribosomal protein S18 acetylase RimI-like enzyme
MNLYLLVSIVVKYVITHERRWNRWQGVIVSEDKYGHTGRKQVLVKQQGLSKARIAEVEQLALLCNRYEHLDMKLSWDILNSRPSDETNDFFYYDNGLLAGYLALFSFSDNEGELSGMVHPAYRCQGIFGQLAAAARAECQRRNISNLMLIVEQASQSGMAFIKRLMLALHHAEYKMVLEILRAAPRANPYLQLRPAVPADGAMLAHITAHAFNMSEHEVDWYTENVIKRSDRQYYLSLLNGICIGKIEVIFDTYEAIICGFGVLPEYQGYGYGRQILTRTVQEILAKGPYKISLEVEIGNEHALSLYKACGFEVTSCYLYYQLRLS